MFLLKNLVVFQNLFPNLVPMISPWKKYFEKCFVLFSYAYIKQAMCILCFRCVIKKIILLKIYLVLLLNWSGSSDIIFENSFSVKPKTA